MIMVVAQGMKRKMMKRSQGERLFLLNLGCIVGTAFGVKNDNSLAVKT